MTDFQRLEEIKKILGMSYNKIADTIGMNNPQPFYDIKAGKCGISYDVASKIQEYFKNVLYKNLNIDWLLTGEGEMLRTETTASLSQGAESEEIRKLKERIKELEEQNAELREDKKYLKELLNSRGLSNCG